MVTATKEVTTSIPLLPRTNPNPAPTSSHINLYRGWPNPSLLPISALNSATTTALEDPTIAHPALEYGPDDGYLPLRQEIAQWLTGFYAFPKHGSSQQPIPTERICITGGASQNIACILQVFSDPVYTRNIWMVAPTYHLASRIFEDAGFAGRLRPAWEDEEGVDVGYLEGEMKRSEERAAAEGNLEPVW